MRTQSPDVIDSPANPRIRAALALRSRRDRDRTGLTLVDGAREARRAIEAGVEVLEAFICPAMLEGADRQVLDSLGGSAAGGGQYATFEVSERAFDRLAYGDRADGIVLVVRTPATTLASLDLGESPLIVVTEDVEKPGNVGAILRSADAAGATAVIAVGGTDLFNPNVIRASVGTIFSVPVVAADAGDVVAWLRASGVRIVASRVDAEDLHVDADLTGSVAVVLGSESVGLSDAWRADDIGAVRLPMLGVADSLNVSAAAAVLLYEAWRQRRAAVGASGRLEGDR